MTSSGPFSSRPKKELADLARKKGVRGWESMSKDELARALDRAAARAKAAKAAAKAGTATATKTRPTKTTRAPQAKSAAKPSKPTKPSTPVPSQRPAAKVTRPAKPAKSGSGRPTAATRKPAAAPAPDPKRKSRPTAPKPLAVPVVPAVNKDLSSGKSPAEGGPTKDRIFLMVPDPFWLHVTWELTHQSVQRAEAALKQDWHGARPVIRLYDVTSPDTTSTSVTPIKDVPVNAQSNHWYIDVPQPPRSYRVDIGYVSRRGEFYPLARSNVATPPKAGATESLDLGMGGELDTKKAERILAMSTGFEGAGNPELKELFEERLRRPLGAPKETGFGTGAALPGSLKKFFFEIDAELIVYGKTDPAAHVTLQNEPVALRPDGTFTMRFSLPDSRQIIPAVATSGDGVEERTIVLAVERNTKHLDPMIHDQMAEG